MTKGADLDAIIAGLSPDALARLTFHRIRPDDEWEVNTRSTKPTHELADAGLIEMTRATLHQEWYRHTGLGRDVRDRARSAALK